MIRGKPSITVAICTLDRAASLRRALHSLALQEGEELPVVVIVDNSPDENARGVWEEFAASFRGEADYATLPEPGLSRGRNLALERSKTRFVHFLDDDVTVPPHWFEALSRGLGPPAPVAAGGPIRPVWEGGRPRWLLAEHETFYSALDLGEEERDFLVPQETPFGANFVVARELALEVGGFDTSLGRVGAALMSGEEIDLLLRVAPHGAVRYLPSAWVNHHIEAKRLTRRWLLRRYFAQGRSGARITLPANGKVPAKMRSVSVPHRLAQLPYRVARRLGRYAASVKTTAPTEVRNERE